MQKTLLPFVLLLLLSITTHAQSWQWAKRGGSTGNWPGNPGDIEQVRDMATDRQGNTYVIGQTNKYQVDVDGHSLGNIFAEGSMVVASFDCQGRYRWAKPIGNYSSAFFLSAIALDTLGGVYIFSGFTSDISSSSGLFPIGNDTTFGTTPKSLVLIKLDSAGAYQWARLPQTDTLSGYSYWSRAIDMAVEPNGTVHLFTMLLPGAHAGGQAVVSSQDLYILKYNAQGRFTAMVKPQLSSVGSFGGWYTRMAYDFHSSRYYFSGSQDSANTVSFNGVPNKDAFYIAAYNAQGAYLWHHQNKKPFTVLAGRVDYDSLGNIYVGGTTYPGDTFQTHIFTNLTNNGFPFAMKLNASGTLQWLKSGATNTGIGAYAIKYANGEVALGGSYPGYLAFDSLKVNVPFNTGYDPYLVRFDATTGVIAGLDSAKGPAGLNDFLTHISSDAKGNFYTGGSVAYQLSFAGHSITNVGGDTDWWVAKFGQADCACTAAPLSAAFTFSAPATNRTVTFTYSGTTVGLDSLVWDWGNGQKQVVTSNYTAPVSYTYPAAGQRYNVCARAYNNCGVTRSCKTVGAAMSVADLGSSEVLNSLVLSPNPATSLVSVAYSTLISGNLEVYDVLGRRVAFEKANAGDGMWKLDVSSYVPGIYRVVLRQEGKVVLYQSLSVRH